MILTIIRIVIGYLAATAVAAVVAVATLVIAAYPASKKTFSYNEQVDNVFWSLLGGWYFIFWLSLVPFLVLLSGLYLLNKKSKRSMIFAGISVAECLLQGSLSFDPIGGYQSRFNLLQNVTAVCSGISAGLTFWAIAVRSGPEPALGVCDEVPR